MCNTIKRSVHSKAFVRLIPLPLNNSIIVVPLVPLYVLLFVIKGFKKRYGLHVHGKGKS